MPEVADLIVGQIIWPAGGLFYDKSRVRRRRLATPDRLRRDAGEPLIRHRRG
jgi:hypothetical protein